MMRDPDPTDVPADYDGPQNVDEADDTGQPIDPPDLPEPQ